MDATMPNTLDTVFYTAHTHTTGGRNGRAVSDDAALDITLTLPASMGGTGTGSNPEQLFAAGYSACFMGALGHVAGLKKITLPPDTAIDASIALGTSGGNFGIAATLKIALPGLDRAIAQDLINAAHEVCPYSRATRGNIDVVLTLG
jgi:Ohr subfamily peroxiredoxin